MGDLANMTSVHGEVNGFRLLCWLRSRAQMERDGEREHIQAGGVGGREWHAGRYHLLSEMANDLAAELTPPDYPEDDDDTVDLDDPAFLGRPEQE